MIRIGFLMSDTGGGHRAAGKAIEAALHHRYPGTFACEYFDVFRRCGLPPVKWAPEIYPRWVARHQPSYDFFVAQMDRFFSTRIGRKGLPSWVLRKGPCVRALREWRGMVVLHAGFSGYAVAVRRAARARIPLLAVITDMASPHSGWYHPGLDRCLVPTPSAIERAIALGLPPDKLRLVGHPAHPKFALLAARLRAAPWKGLVHVYGFVTNMELLMRGADLVVGKPGPGVIAEAAIMGLPMVLTGGMVNGLANVRFVTDAGAGVYAKGPEEVRAVVARWLSSPDELARRRENTPKIAYPNASLDIADEIARAVGVAVPRGAQP